MPGKSQYLWGGKEKNLLFEPEIGKARAFVFHPQTSAMQQVELHQETPSKPTAHEAALGKKNLKGPSVPARPIPALEGRSDPGLQDWGPSAVPQQDGGTAPALSEPSPKQPGAPGGGVATEPTALLKGAGPGGPRDPRKEPGPPPRSFTAAATDAPGLTGPAETKSHC